MQPENNPQITTNWLNVDLKSNYDKMQAILPMYSFETLLLEISCNLKTEELTIQDIKKHAINELNLKHKEALTILNDNINNITKEAVRERNIK